MRLRLQIRNGCEKTNNFILIENNRKVVALAGIWDPYRNIAAGDARPAVWLTGLSTTILRVLKMQAAQKARRDN